MALSALDDLSVTPTDEQVAQVVGESLTAWDSLKVWLESSVGIDGWEWGSTGRKYGWGLRARSGTRNIAYLIPQHGSFLVGLVLGDRATEIARGLDLSPAVVDMIDGAKRYGEGTGFRLPVAGLDDLADIKLLVQAKVSR